MGIFLNHTNHNSEFWTVKQRKEAEKYGKIVEFPFPPIPPEAGSNDVKSLAEKNAAKIADLKPKAVLCQGEFTYTYYMVQLLQKMGIIVLAACSCRNTREWKDDDGSIKKEAVFDFVQFREY